MSAVGWGTNLGEIHQHFSHLVTTLTTTNVDNDITVGELGDTLGDDSLSTSEGTRNTDSTTLDTREQGVQHSLTDNERCVRRELLVDRSGHTDRPGVHHAVFRLDSIELNFQQLLLDSVASRLGYAGDGTPRAGREDDLVVVHQAVLENGTPDVTTGDVIADLVLAGLEVPLLLTIQGVNRDTTGDVDTLGLVRDRLQGPLNSIVNRFHQTGAQLDRQGLSCPCHGVADRQTS